MKDPRIRVVLLGLAWLAGVVAVGRWLVEEGVPVDHLVVVDLTRSGARDRLVAQGGALVLAPGALEGVYSTGPRRAPFAFDQLVTSWNATAPPGTRIIVEARVAGVAGPSVWSRWFHVATWGDPPGGDPGPRRQEDEVARLEEDTIEVRGLSGSYELRVTLQASGEGEGPRLTLAAVALTRLRMPASQAHGMVVVGAEGSARGKVLPVPFRSQRWEDASIAGRICCPTSLAMVMDYLGVGLPTAQVAAGCYDRRNDIYGNWSMAAAYAGSRGLEALVARWRTLAAVESEIAGGRPVILSLSFAQGELEGAPMASTSGHLLVVRGFTPKGDVVVNDPAGTTPLAGQVVYRRAQVQAAWKSGAAILVRPRPARPEEISGQG